MQWLAEICIRRPVFAVMLILALVVAGLAAYLRLGVDRFPQMDMPTVYVSTMYPNAAAEEVESEVTQLMEDSVATVAGIEELRSLSREGYSLLILTFLMLIALFVPGLGTRVDGACRWFRLGGLSVQPSEGAKLTLVIFLAASLAQKGDQAAAVTWPRCSASTRSGGMY